MWEFRKGGLFQSTAQKTEAIPPLLPVQKPENGIIFSKPAFGPSRTGIKFCFFLPLFVGRVLPAAPNVSLHPQQNRGFITPGQIKGMAPSVDERRGAIPFFEFLFAIGC